MVNNIKIKNKRVKIMVNNIKIIKRDNKFEILNNLSINIVRHKMVRYWGCYYARTIIFKKLGSNKILAKFWSLEPTGENKLYFTNPVGHQLNMILDAKKFNKYETQNYILELFKNEVIKNDDFIKNTLYIENEFYDAFLSYDFFNEFIHRLCYYYQK